MRPLSPQLMALHKVKNLLHNPDDWIQGTFYEARYPGRGRFCLANAIMAVTDDPILMCQVCEMIANLVPGGRIPTWNDAPERTHADVIALLGQAILNQEMVDAA